MNFDRLNKWLMLGANIGVIVGIIFLVIEINQNTQQAELDTAALQTSNYQDLISGVTNLNSYIIENPEFAELLLRGEAAPSTLTPAELSQFNSYSIITYRHGDMAYYQFQQGTISKERLDGLLSVVVARLESGTQAQFVWELFKNAGNLDSSYVEHVENLWKQGRYARINEALSDNSVITN